MYQSSGSTSCMWKHLKAFHRTELASLQRPSTTASQDEMDEGAESGNCPPPAKRPIQTVMHQYAIKDPYLPNSIPKKRLDNKLLKMMVKDMQPYNIVNDEGFREFVYALDPRYQLPSRSTLIRNLEEQYDTTKTSLKKKMEEADHISVTTDMWTSINTEAYLAVTAHFIIDDSLMSCLLDVHRFPQRHTADEIAAALHEIFRDFNIENKVGCVVTDNAANMVTEEISAELNVTASKCIPMVRNLQKVTTSMMQQQEKANSIPKKRLDNKLLKMMVKDMQPYNIVNDEGFREFVYALDPRYQLPSRSTLIRNLEEQYDTTKTSLKKKMEEADHISVTTDMWTSINTEAYLAVTAHFIIDDSLMSCLLDVHRFPQRHTADEIAAALHEIFRDFNIENKVGCVVTDNAANMVAAVKKLVLRHMPCFAHTLNLIVKDGLSAVAELTETREKVTEEISAELNVTASKCIPMVRNLQKVTTSMMQQQEKGNIGYRLAEALNGTLQRRCSAYETSRLLSKATILDPRFKTLGFISPQKADEAVKSLSSEGAMFVLEGQAQASTPLASSTANELWHDFDTQLFAEYVC
ncbi:zinc finger BED domain-containing 1-like protein [Labeo rohita]|uniref:Zinc finger BED domain-containing 1-like protein n=1 Tax=Labeo rohita TaxID=84645 RepID=A0A498LJL3_LABRO|nr:zinc finger BED domain-containing 1-like protein [Labeo rohita]